MREMHYRAGDETETETDHEQIAQALEDDLSHFEDVTHLYEDVYAVETEHDYITRKENITIRQHGFEVTSGVEFDTQKIHIERVRDGEVGVDYVEQLENALSDYESVSYRAGLYVVESTYKCLTKADLTAVRRLGFEIAGGIDFSDHTVELRKVREADE